MLMEAQRETVGLNKGGGSNQHRVKNKPSALATLAEVHIDKDLAKSARISKGWPAIRFCFRSRRNFAGQPLDFVDQAGDTASTSWPSSMRRIPRSGAALIVLAFAATPSGERAAT